MRAKMVGLGLAGLVAATLLAAPMAAHAATGVNKSGSWGSAHYLLNLSLADSGKIESDLNVTTAVNGQNWLIRMRDNGVLFYRATRTVMDHELEARGFAVNQPGSDVIKVIATNESTGQTYSTTATF